MKILSISNCPLVESQGSGYVALNFIRGLRGLGHEVDAFGPEDFEPLANWRRGRNPRLALGMAWCAWVQLSRKKYDLVEFYGGHAWLAVTLLRWIPNRAWLLVNHTNGLEPYCELTKTQSLCPGEPSRRWWNTALKRAYSKVDGIVTVSEDERRFAVRSELQRPDRVVHFENALPESFLDLPIEPNRPPVILYCGSWLARKGVQILTQDIPAILREHPDYRFRLLGVGSSFLKEKHFPSDVCPQIEVIPFLADKDQLRQQYQSARIVVVPSIYESFGLVAAEAMACGCAVVATNTGFGADLKSWDEAVIMTERRSPALYAALKSLLADDARRMRIAAQGRARVQRLRWEPTVRGIEKVYLRWLGERQPKSSPSLAAAQK